MKSSNPTLGKYIRNEVIPKGMSVTKAAEKLEVSRVTLSRLLNDQVPLSANMADRLGQAFGADAKSLLDQRTDLGARLRHRSSSLLARHAVPLIPIRARQIEKWAEYTEARSRLAIFLRMLIQSTVEDSFQFSVPSYGGSENIGWDGVLESETATPWIPSGRSRWKFNTGKNVAVKANKDYFKLSESTPQGERTENAFVFVTTRLWPGKMNWKKAKEAEGKWREIKALDASDIEQWLTTSISAQVWFAEQLGMDTNGLATLDEAWRNWVNIESGNIELSSELFKHAVSIHLKQFNKFLAKKKRRALLSVTADSTDEALAFLYCLFNEIADYTGHRRQVLIVSEQRPLVRMLRDLHPQTVLIACTPEAQDVIRYASSNPKIIISPRDALNSRPDFEVSISRVEFTAALGKMGVDNFEKAELYTQESGCSPTVLRRIISDNPAINRPEWGTGDIAKKMIPLVFLGTWNKGSTYDCEIVSFLANQEYSEIENTIGTVLRLEDSPLWSKRGYCGLVSKKDALFTIAKHVTKTNIVDFFKCAKELLAKNRWSDSNLLFPKEIREHINTRYLSDALIRSVSESLVLLAVYGNDLFKRRIDVDIKQHIEKLIRNLLTPLTHEKLLAHDSELPNYAEAAPEVFLEIVEDELKNPMPAFDKSLGSGLLCAFENLAWNHLGRVTLILSKLSKFEIKDNSMNNLINSLSRIYCSWHPRTNASHDERFYHFEQLAKNSPDIARQLLMSDLSQATKIKNYYFNWRKNALEIGKKTSKTEKDNFQRTALNVVLNMDLNTSALGSLVKHLGSMGNEHQKRVWELINKWEVNATDGDKAFLREQIRRLILNVKSDWGQAAYEKLMPQDLIFRHLWLFQAEDFPLSSERSIDHSENLKQLETKRNEALNDIIRKHGINGVFSLLAQSDNPHVVGKTIGNVNFETDVQLSVVQHCLVSDRNYGTASLEGFLSKTEPEAFLLLLNEFDPSQQVRLLKCAPFDSNTWRLLNQLEPDIKQEYWWTVEAESCFSADDLNEAAGSFLEIKRPFDAFNTVIEQWEKIDTSLLKNILFAVAESGREPDMNRGPFRYYLENAITSLVGKYSPADNQLAFLEFSFLNSSTHAIPCLEHKIAQEPRWFSDAIFNRYLSEDGKEKKLWEFYDPRVFRKKTNNKIRLMLEKIQRLPGTDDNGNIDTRQLQMWIKKVQEFSKENNESFQLAELEIGNLLAKAPIGQEREWPDFAVCEAMEQCQSQTMADSFRKNAFDKHFRVGVTGISVRVGVIKFRKWAEQQKENRNYFAAEILTKIAQDYEEKGFSKSVQRQNIPPLRRSRW